MEIWARLATSMNSFSKYNLLQHKFRDHSLSRLWFFSQCYPAHVRTQRGCRSVSAPNQTPVQEGLHSARCCEISQIEFVGTSRRVGTSRPSRQFLLLEVDDTQLPPHAYLCNTFAIHHGYNTVTDTTRNTYLIHLAIFNTRIGKTMASSQ